MSSNVLATNSDIDVLEQKTINRARKLIELAEKNQRLIDKSNRRRFKKLFQDQNAISVTVTLTDEVMRIKSSKDAARILFKAASKATKAGFSLFNFLGLKSLILISKVMPRVSVSLVHMQVKRYSKGIILPAEQKPLNRHMTKRRKTGINLNINVLGEAVLGQAEADERFNRIIEMMNRAEINYISVKLSAIVAQLNAIDHDGSIARLSEKLRDIYRAANKNNCFVNLDMEEFRDLRLTVDLFKAILNEPEFESLYAGIVLQAYLPDSHQVFAELVEWSNKRNKKSGGQIKIRLVKGANLAMEKAEAELHGWISAPYPSKSDVDASYSRLLDTAINKEVAQSVRIGVASHNLFHISLALEIATLRGCKTQIDLEMLEGMANPEALAVTKELAKIKGNNSHILLYSPVTRSDDFASAVAYLVRRLDENTAPENYLRSSFEIASNPQIFNQQAERFKNAFLARKTISTSSRRLADKKVVELNDKSEFINDPNGDPTDLNLVSVLEKEITKVLSTKSLKIPLVIAAEQKQSSDTEIGIDPNDNGKPWYEYSVATKKDVDAAIKCAKSAIENWNNIGAKQRAQILEKCARQIDDERLVSIAIMSRDAGKTFAEADPEVSEAIDFANFYAANAEKINMDSDSTPTGVVVVVPPWNFPYSIPAGGIFAALAAGNSVIFKSAPETVATSWQLVNQIWQAGVPKEVLQFVSTRDDEVGKHLVSNPEVNAVILTGAFSTAEMFSSWRAEMNLLAETSGKNSIILTASCDIDVAVKDLVQSAFGNAGQKCSAASLAIVQKSIYEDPSFKRQLVDAVTTLKIGKGYELSTSVGPVIRKVDKNENTPLARALTTLDEGETWWIEPKQLDDAGFIWQPGVKVGVKPGSWSHLNEWFGPVLAIMVAPDLESSILWQNQTPYGLTAGIQSLDENECEKWIEKVQAGNVYVNRTITGAIVNRQPFGGWKRSSVGANAKAGGENYLATLRNWRKLQHFLPMKEQAVRWWKQIGSQSIDRAGLKTESNLQRYRSYENGILVRIDSGTSKDEIAFLEWIKKELPVKLVYSSPDLINGLTNVIVESVDDFIERAVEFNRVRWLSIEAAPIFQLLKRGISCDPRAIAQRGDIELSRWFLEQSVSITQHRYGNTNAGPKPRAIGLAS